MRTTRVLAPGELEETDDFQGEGGVYPPTGLEPSPVPSAGFVYATHAAKSIIELIAAGELIGTTAGSAEPITKLVGWHRHSAASGGPWAADITEILFAALLKETRIVHRAESAHDIARRMALESPAVAVEPFTPVASDNPARDLRDWTQLTTDELARMCRVTGRRFHHWLGGARMSSKSEERLLRLRYQAGILATGFGPAGVRRWFRAPHPELGTTPIEAIAEGREDTVHQLVERYIESPAT